MTIAYSQMISFFKRAKKSRLFLLTALCILLQISINAIGVLGPEIGFDALWYHLTLPKLYLTTHAIAHFNGGILYYSDMPKLIEMLYIPGLVFFQETGAKGIHFLFGILCCIALYKLGRKFFSPLISLCAVALFYSNLVVGWESISAYIDLARTFFEILVVYALFHWFETKKQLYTIFAAICFGLAITTKFLALGDFAVFIPILILLSPKKSAMSIVRTISFFIVIALLIPLPWWIFSWIHTGNPFYPFFSPVYPFDSNISHLFPWQILTTMWDTFTHSADPISPMYLAFLPFLFFVKNWDKKKTILFVTGMLSLVVWYLSPQTGGGRFVLVYLPVLSLLVMLVYSDIEGSKKYLFLVVFFFTLLFSIMYRSAANAKFLPVLLHKETKASFLATHLNFSFGDYYDIDGYMAKHISQNDKVLLFGYHNLYYIDFPYIPSSAAKKGDRFDYIATDGQILPMRFAKWKEIYTNHTTHMHLYTHGGQTWTY